MGAKSGYIIFAPEITYKDLTAVYEELLTKFLKETNQDPEDENFTKMLIRSSINDLEMNRKPEGYNRNNRIRLIFPITPDGRVKFYIYRTTRSEDIVRITESLSTFLRDNGLQHEIKWDEMLLYKVQERKKPKKK